MANATATIQEIRFDVRDEQMTHVYVLVRAGGDAPIGVQGWARDGTDNRQLSR